MHVEYSESTQFQIFHPAFCRDGAGEPWPEDGSRSSWIGRLDHPLTLNKLTEFLEKAILV